MWLKRLVVVLVALAMLTPNISIAAPYSYGTKLFADMYFKYDAQRNVFLDTAGASDNICRLMQMEVSHQKGDRSYIHPCAQPRIVPAFKLVIPQSVYSSSVGGGSVSATMRYRAAKDKLIELGRAVSIATTISVETMRGSKLGASAREARTLLMGLASRYRLISDGELQDLLNCSRKDILAASEKVTTDPVLAKAAESIWSAYSAMRISQANRTTRRAPVMTDVTSTVPGIFGVSWSDVRMYANDREREECGQALQAIVVIARDVLRKGTSSIARSLALSEADVRKLHSDATENVSRTGPFWLNVLRACGDLGVTPPTNWT
jgi:hypothetical protein